MRRKGAAASIRVGWRSWRGRLRRPKLCATEVLPWFEAPLRARHCADLDATPILEDTMKRALLLGALLTLSSAATLAAQAAPARPAAPAGRAAAAAPDIVGKWEFTVESPQGTQVMTVTFARANNVLSGSGEGQFGAFQVADVMLASSDLSFVMKFAMDGQSLDIPFKGKVTGATAEGSLTFAMGDAPQNIPWKAKKLP
jgi:hypothetical protein